MAVWIYNCRDRVFRNLRQMLIRETRQKQNNNWPTQSVIFCTQLLIQLQWLALRRSWLVYESIHGIHRLLSHSSEANEINGGCTFSLRISLRQVIFSTFPPLPFYYFVSTTSSHSERKEVQIEWLSLSHTHLRWIWVEIFECARVLLYFS